MGKRWVVLVAAAALAGMACGVAQQPQNAAGSTAQATADQPKHGGVLNARWTEDPWDWDMSYTGQSTVNADSMRLAYSTLLSFKSGPDVGFSEYVLQPGLAESWQVSPDATTFTFHLRRGVKFADLPPVNGRELTAADIKWTYEYYSRSGQFKDKHLGQGQTEWMFEGMQAIDTPDPYTVVVHFKNSFAPFLSYAATALNPIVPHEIYDQDGNLKGQIAGTGPFQLDMGASQKGTRWVFKKNPNYWEPGKPYIDEIRNLVIKDDAAAYAAFQARQIDLIDGVADPKMAEQIQGNNPDAQRFEALYSGLYILLQTKHPPLDNPKVRRAFSMALDRDEFIQTLSGGKGQWFLAGEGMMTDLFTDEERKSIEKQDVNQARQLLAEAGFPNGVTLEMHVPSDRGDSQIKQSELVQAQVRRAGINVELKTMPYAEVSTSRKKGHQFQIDYFNEYPRPDVDAVLFSTFYPGAQSNYTDIDDPALTKLLLAQRQEPDPAKRRELIRNAVRYIAEHDEGVGVFRPVRYAFAQPYVKHYAPHMDKGTGNYAASAGLNSWLAK